MENKKKKRPREFDVPLPKPPPVTSMYVPDGYCNRLSGVTVECHYGRRCHLCDIAHRTAITFRYDPPYHPILNHLSVQPKNRGKGLSYYNKIVAVKEECLERLGRKSTLYYQLFKCVDGFGCHAGNDIWEIDGYFISHPDEPVTLRRSDILGIPTPFECKRIDRIFFTNTLAECGYVEGGDVI